MENSDQKILDIGENDIQTEERNPLSAESSPLVQKMGQHYSLFAGISLLFGVIGTILFYKADLGLNSFLFVLVMISLLSVASKRLELPQKIESRFCYLGAMLLGLSNMLTSNESLQFLNSIGILLLLELSLMIQFGGEQSRSFASYLFRMFELPMKIIASIGMPFIDCNRYIKKSKLFSNDKIRNIFIGCVLAIPFILIISALLSSADLLFNKLTSSFYDYLFSSNIVLIILLILLGFTLCYSILYGSLRESSNGKVKTKANPVIAITITSLLLIVYLIFCGIQVVYLFASGIFQLPVEFTYAEYARRGFFELLAVTCFNIVLILICMNVFREHKILKWLLAAITASTYIMIASAAYRMLLYIGAYHLTFLRLIVLLFLLIDSLLLAGVIASVFRNQFPLFAYGVAVISICFILFSLSKPDYFIAKYFINNAKDLEQEDIEFLTEELSYDAAPAVVPFLKIINKAPNSIMIAEKDQEIIPLLIERYQKNIAMEVSQRDVREYNRSLNQADQIIEQYLK